MNPSLSFLEYSEGIEMERSRLVERLRGVNLDREASKIEACGRKLVLTRNGEELRFCWCRFRFCPSCRPRLAREIRERYLPKVRAAMGPEGAACFVTLTHPPTSEPWLDRGLWFNQDLRRFRTSHQWKQGSRYGRKAGVITSLELAKGQADPGHLHGHQLVLAPSPEQAQEVAEWMLSDWLARHPRASWNAQRMEGPFPGEPSAGQCLAYLAKGSPLDLGWPDAHLVDAVSLFHGMHAITASGLGMRQRRSAT